MQDKKLDDLTKKYKEEMMRLYSKNRTPAASVPQNIVPPPKNERLSGNVRPPQPMAPASPQNAADSEKTAAEAPKLNESMRNIVRYSPRGLYGRTAAPEENTLPESVLSHPPMPEIPKNYGTQDVGNIRDVPNIRGKQNDRDIRITPRTRQPAVKPTPKADRYRSNEPQRSPVASKFPSASELLKGMPNYPPAASMADPLEDTSMPKPEFVPTEEHNQGNYDFSPVPNGDTAEDFESDMLDEIQPNESYPNGKTDFSAVDRGDVFPEENPSDMGGEGYLQVEVTTASRALPVQNATVIITEIINGMDSLIGMVVTDENGGSPVIPLSAPLKSFSEAPDPSERPYSEYNIKVYKQGFYSVPQLTVPIFDSIKSIQPVSLIPLAESELEGASEPNGNR